MTTVTGKKLTLATCLFAAFAANAQVVNGDFESWTSGQPDGWSTIDSGISVSQSAVSYSGNAAAAITVNTGTQGNTDFRQTVNVTAGESYTFSTWVYHTEGNVAVRLYVDGYQNYSNPALTGQWQQISYTYNAPATAAIEVGARFYDQSGFDGSELVYLDNFQPSSGGSTGGGTGGSCSSNSGTFSLTTDNYGEETSWEITNSSGQPQFSGSGYASNTQYAEDICLDDGDYTLSVYDAYGDGICCSYGSGEFALTINGQVVASGSQFAAEAVTNFTLGSGGNGGGGSGTDLSAYYQSAEGLSGYALKSALYDIIKSHAAQSYGDLWTFYISYEQDAYYENDGSILDIYSESPAGNDPYNFSPGSDQCGTYSGEAGCYNREHSFPRSWFGGAIAPMNTDVHHIFPTDGYVNSKRSSYPYGEVGSASYVSSNGSKLGSAASGLGYSGTVFEPIDEFKGDIARAYLYMATRYENQIAGWESQSSYGDAVLNGTSSQAFESWFLTMLKRWHQEDPVSQKEIDRNEAAYQFQGNRNPFVDYPSFVTTIWGN